MPGKILSEADVARLLSDTSVAARAETATKVATGFSQTAMTDAERELAQEIFRIMVKDAEVRVREALAENLKDNAAVPHDVALSLAQDVDSVSLPVLEFSEVLSDEDLVEIIRDQDVSKQMAIAKRATVSEDLSEALVESGNEEVVTTLVENDGAEIADTSMQKVLNSYGESESIQKAIIHRPKLSVTVSERLMAMVSDQLKDELVKRQEGDPSLAVDLILQSREKATINLSTVGDEDDLLALVKQLNENNRLTPSIMLRALVMGDLNFFEASMAELVGLPVANVRQLIHDSGDRGLKALYAQANLPAAQYPAVTAAISVAGEMELDGGEHDRERYSRRMIERVLTQYGDLGVEFESDDLEYLLTKMNDITVDSLDTAAQ